MSLCLFATDLHGTAHRYRRLFGAIEAETPAAVFLGGDLLPSPAAQAPQDFLERVLAGGFARLRERLKNAYPRVFVILGNDDGRGVEPWFREQDAEGLWQYAHGRRLAFKKYAVYGYAYVPPTPFLLKDWEKYDVGGYIPPGCVAPEDGRRSVPATRYEITRSTIKAGSDDLSRAVFLFHGPPHDTVLDRAALDGRSVDHVPLDVHVGSIAVRRFIEERKPHITMHGHIHESARITGAWRQTLGRTRLFGGAHDGPELALIRFDPDHPDRATRDLL